jgi:hypothetical protein
MTGAKRIFRGKNPHQTEFLSLGASAVGPHHQEEIGRNAAGKMWNTDGRGCTAS